VNITYEPKFVNSFNNIWDYISLDSKIRANQFKSELKDKIENLVHIIPHENKKAFYKV
jgi:toxin ParE1/3/4